MRVPKAKNKMCLPSGRRPARGLECCAGFESLESRVLLSAAHSPKIVHPPKPPRVPPPPPHHVKIQKASKKGINTTLVAKDRANGVQPAFHPAPTAASNTPASIDHAYGVDQVNFDGITGDGTGQTIAIADAYDQPSFVSSTDPNFATSDLAKFDAYFGLPNPPSFTKMDQTGGTD